MILSLIVLIYCIINVIKQICEMTRIKKIKCFQCTKTVTLNHEQIKKDPQKITKIKPFIDKYNWEK